MRRIGAGTVAPAADGAVLLPPSQRTLPTVTAKKAMSSYPFLRLRLSMVDSAHPRAGGLAVQQTGADGFSALLLRSQGSGALFADRRDSVVAFGSPPFRARR